MSIILATTVDINATRDEVWAVLTDFASYGEWSNFSAVDGVAQVGTKLAMRMPGFNFTSTVTVVKPGEELEWAAKIFQPGIFYGRHTFVLTTNPDGSTHVANTETFTGWLTKPFGGMFKSSGGKSAGGYAKFNEALKARVEGRAKAMPVVAS